MAKPDALFKKGVIAQVAIIANDGPDTNMGKGPDPGASSNDRTWINEGLGVDVQGEN